MSGPSDTLIAADPVRQFSVFIENRVGRLNELIGGLHAQDIHLVALAVVSLSDAAIARIVVDDHSKARALLEGAGFRAQDCEVLAVEIATEADIKGVLAALLEAEVNLDYSYGFIQRPQGRSGLVLKVEDAEVAAQSLRHRGIRVLTQHDIAR